MATPSRLCLPRLFIFGRTLPYLTPQRSSSKVLDLSPESPPRLCQCKVTARLVCAFTFPLLWATCPSGPPPGPSPSPRSQTHSFGTRGFTERSAACCGRASGSAPLSLSVPRVVGPLSALALSHSLLPFKLFLSLFSPHFSRHPFVARLSTTRAGFPTIAPRDLFPPTRAPLSSRRFSSSLITTIVLPSREPSVTIATFLLDTHTLFGFSSRQHRERV
ncbi:hypothetical protein QBC41DRAFT_62491 [Cercophora samala]|uniref:Uncharacterized protein n=1 Tax=Cercophora samala TaxID=330535 RepID=A0AA40DC69_9PEZI|nr:hypothetical protein QBC41DRAFT_62491 [Cercophora samala]